VKLDSRERKLLLLAIDPAATPDEALAALRVLFRGWLFRYPDGHALVKALGENGEPVTKRKPQPDRRSSPHNAVVLGFGKHRGKCVREIPPDYLIWVLHNFEDLWPETQTAIERYLNQ
jgi:hypothetical protein